MMDPVTVTLLLLLLLSELIRNELFENVVSDTYTLTTAFELTNGKDKMTPMLGIFRHTALHTSLEIEILVVVRHISSIKIFVGR